MFLFITGTDLLLPPTATWSPGYLASAYKCEDRLVTKVVFSLSALFVTFWVLLGCDVVSEKDPLRENASGTPLFGTAGAWKKSCQISICCHGNQKFLCD